MYKSFTARNFRCFDKLTVEPLGWINLITGKNNVGKTALLEALWLHQGYFNPELGLRVNAMRGLGPVGRDEFLWELFSEFDPERTIELLSQDSDNRPRSLRITVQEHPISRVSLGDAREGNENRKEFPVAEAIPLETTQPVGSEVLLDYTDASGQTSQARAFVEPHAIRFERSLEIKERLGIFLATRRRDNPEVPAERFSNLAVVKKQDKIIDILRVIDPRLTSMTVQRRGVVSMLYGDIGMTRLMPVPLMGDGMSRLLEIVLGIPEIQDGIILIDEIENGMHHRVMNRVWKAIADLARDHNVQIFATTHSAECYRAAQEVFRESDQYDFRVHRLERVKDTIQAITYDQETLEAAIEMDVEVR